MKIRSFLAVKLPDPLKEELERVQNRLRSKLPHLAWVKPSAMHLTVKFFGDIEMEQVEEIQGCAQRVMQHSSRFSLAAQGLGVFPNIRMPRILWVGISGETKILSRLVDDLDEALATLEFPKEGKPFNPHLTLARIKSQGREVGEVLVKKKLLEPSVPIGSIDVTHVSLFKSELRASGSVYTCLWDVSLPVPS